ncbi:MAG: sigma-E processing peptidase SpoIIGA [Bacillota bacterium]|nr:sigma-E processing peptidase SpoIIGA [Bacillota bacterium]
MVVYGDILFAENFIIGMVILYITARITGERITGAIRKLRLVAGGIMCGLFSLVIFLPVRMPVVLLMELAFAMAVCLVLFGKKTLWKKALIFILVTYCMGGITMALLLLTHNPGIYTATGIYTGDMKAGLLAVFIALCLITALQIIKTVTDRKFYREHVFAVTICIGEFHEEMRGFLDTGNELREPVSGKPVAVADGSLWERMERAGALAPERLCMVPYASIGSKGLLQAVRTDHVEINGRRIKGCVIAKGEGSFRMEERKIEGCDLLLSNEMSDGKL